MPSTIEMRMQHRSQQADASSTPLGCVAAWSDTYDAAPREWYRFDRSLESYSPAATDAPDEVGDAQ